MTDYTPTTEEVREDYASGGLDLPYSELVAQFDRWYEAEKAKWIQQARVDAAEDVKSKALEVWDSICVDDEILIAAARGDGEQA